MKLRRPCFGYLIRAIDGSSVYVGISYYPEKRFADHRKVAEKGSDKALYVEMRSNEMSLSIQDRFESVDQARSWEILAIEKFRSEPDIRILNNSDGGEHPHLFGFTISGSAFAICKNVRRLGQTWALDFKIEGSDAEARMFLNDSACSRSYVDVHRVLMRWKRDANICVGRRFSVNIENGRVTRAVAAW